MNNASRHLGSLLSGKTGVSAPTPSPSPGASAILKVAVQTKGQQPMLYEFDQKQPLAAIIRDVCSKWSLATPDSYCFQHTDTREYITEKNRRLLKNGALLQVAEFPNKDIGVICNELKSDDQNVFELALGSLIQDIKEENRTAEFIGQDGIVLLTARLIDGPERLGKHLPLVLSTLQDIIEYSQQWELITEPVVKSVVRIGVDPAGLYVKLALSLLESTLRHSTKHLPMVRSNITLASIMTLISCPITVPESRIAALSFLNTLVMKSMPADRTDMLEELKQAGVVDMIDQNIIASYDMTSETASHLACFQGLYLSALGQRLMTQFEVGNKIHDVMLSNFLRIVQVSMNRYRPVGLATYPAVAAAISDCSDVDVSRMGFGQSQPAHDFMDLPGGVLALECLTYYAQKWPDECDQHFASNLSRSPPQQCPFVRSGLALVRVLAEIFFVIDKAYPANYRHYKIFFSTASFFREFFSLAMQLFNKTWREMGAALVDVDKVAGVVKRQILVVLKADYADWGGLKAALWDMNYAKISALIEEEKNRFDDLILRKPPARELSARRLPNIVDLVKKQRLKTLEKGAFFPNLREKDKGRQKSSWYCRLHPNHMVIHWAECETSPHPVPYSLLTNKVMVSEVRELVVGKDCPHVKSSSKKPGAWSNFAFALMYNSEDYLGFLAEDETTFATWMDGLRILLKQQMSEESSQKDIDMILEMDMKVQLLGVENTHIPEQAPKIPPDPAEFDFHYKSESDFPQ